jgi:hypothetical protein
MKIEIEDYFEPLVKKIALANNITPNIVLESAFTFTVAITKLPNEKQELIREWLENT